MTLLGFGPDSGTKAMASIIVTWRATEPAWSAPPRTALSATGRGQLPPAGANIVDEAIHALPAAFRYRDLGSSACISCGRAIAPTRALQSGGFVWWPGSQSGV